MWQPTQPQLHALLEHVSEPLLVFDVAGGLVYANLAGRETLELENPDIPPDAKLTRYQDHFDLCDLDGSVLAETQLPLPRLLRGDSFRSLELRVRRRDTGQSWIRSFSGVVLNGDPSYLLLTMRDLTDLHQAEERLSMAVEANPVPVAVIFVDDDAVCDLNPAFATLLGRTRLALLGKRLSVLVPELRASLETGTDPFEIEIEIGTNGDRRHLLVTGHAVSAGDRPVQFLTFLDLTRWRKLEDAYLGALDATLRDAALFSHNVVERLNQLRSRRFDDAEGPPPPDLTTRERQVLALIAAGFDNQRITARLGLAPTTVRNYVSRIYRKLDLHSRAEAVVWARERGLIAD